jgi:hypothetical protein
MGFIQGDTNNIILDGVLTDLGRQFIAKNDGSFSIIKFAASDDEVDYTIIKEFGRTFGQEKIEKNTPVFEGCTNQNLAQKYRLLSVSNPNLIRLPYLQLQGEGVGVAGNSVSIGNTTIKRRTITLFQEIREGNVIDVELRDNAFMVTMDNRFIQLLNATPDTIDRDQKATYILTRETGETSLGGSRVSLQLATKAILDSQFTVFGSRADKSIINTYVRVSGVNSGATKEFEVQVTKSL